MGKVPALVRNQEVSLEVYLRSEVRDVVEIPLSHLVGFRDRHPHGVYVRSVGLLDDNGWVFGQLGTSSVPESDGSYGQMVIEPGATSHTLHGGSPLLKT
jgi:hypothetical protein